MRTKFTQQPHRRRFRNQVRRARPAGDFPGKSGSDLSVRERQRLAILCGLAMLLAIVSVTRAAHSGTPPATEPKYIKSVFIKAPAPGSGKDPFFPKTTRFGPVQVAPIPDVAQTPVTCMSLKGISTSKGHRTAIVNNRTFEVGEEAEVRACGQIFRVKCIDIRDDGVIVSVAGQTQKLSLGPKL